MLRFLVLSFFVWILNIYLNLLNWWRNAVICSGRSSMLFTRQTFRFPWYNFQHSLVFSKYNKVVDVLSKVVICHWQSKLWLTKGLKSCAWLLSILSFSNLSSALLLNFFISSFVANVFLFSFKPDSLTNFLAAIFAWSILFVNLLKSDVMKYLSLISFISAS